MPRIISLDEKLAVIDDWLSAESRNEIAIKRNIGNGTVYNIIQEWRNGIGVTKADRLRDIAIQLKKTGLSITDCATGLRTLMILKKYGIKENDDQEHLIYFLKEIYTRCQEVGFTSQQVFDYISDILKFSSEISISQIPHFMKKKIEEKEELESVLQKLSTKINELSDVQEEKEQEIERLSKIEETMTKTYRTFIIAKRQLKQYGIGMDNIDMFVKSVVGIAKENHDPLQVLAKIADYENLEKNSRYFNEQVNLKKDELTKLNQDIDRQQKIRNYFKIKLDIIDELEIRGFNIQELRTLINMLNEIGRENDSTFDEIRNEFFKDVKNYEEVIGSRKEKDRLQKELKILEEETMKEREKHNAYPKVIESIIGLAGAGIYETDIVKINKILSMTDYYYQDKDKPMSKEALIDDLQKYRNLKLVIQNLENVKKDMEHKKKSQYKSMKKKTSHIDKTIGK
jgi:DNA repair exonuclease SbcCD ATPase subunit